MEWLIKIVPGVITTLVGFCGGYQLHKIKARHEVRQKHFEQIKSRVFQPILKLFSDYYIPLLEQQRWKSSLYVNSQPIYQNKSVLDSQVSHYEYRIAITTPVLPNIDQYLLNDAKKNHYSRFILKIEKFQSSVDKYNKACHDYAEEIKQEMLSKIDLPEYRYQINNLQDEWINASELSIFILNKQLEVYDYNLNLKPSDRSGKNEKEIYELVRMGDPVFAHGSKERIDLVVEFVETRLKQPGQKQELVEMATTLLGEANKLKNELEDLNLTYKLPGTCSYCKI